LLPARLCHRRRSSGIPVRPGAWRNNCYFKVAKSDRLSRTGTEAHCRAAGPGRRDVTGPVPRTRFLAIGQRIGNRSAASLGHHRANRRRERRLEHDVGLDTRRGDIPHDVCWRRWLSSEIISTGIPAGSLARTTARDANLWRDGRTQTAFRAGRPSVMTAGPVRQRRAPAARPRPHRSPHPAAAWGRSTAVAGVLAHESLSPCWASRRRCTLPPCARLRPHRR
jgi:hypothetical protein